LKKDLNAKYSKEDPGVLSRWNPISDKNGTKLLSQRSSNWSLELPDWRLLLIEAGMPHGGKHEPVPTF